MKKVKTLQAARLKFGKTQQQAADQLGMSKQMYQKYEYGMSAKAIQTAIRIAKMYGTTVEKLWLEEGENGNNEREEEWEKPLLS